MLGNTGRGKRILANTLVGVVGQVLIIVVGFVSRKLFIAYLGQELSGLSSTFSNVLNFLDLASTGIAGVAQYKIFQYNAANDTANLNKTYYFMKKMYSTIALGIFFAGIFLSFKIDWLIYDNPYSDRYLQQVFMLILCGNCVSHLYGHIRAFLAAMEHMFVYQLIYTVIYLAVTACNLIAVVIWREYVLYLAILVLQNVLTGVVLSLVARSKFQFLRRRNRGHFQDQQQLLGEIRNVFPRAIANFIYNSTDNIVISACLGLVSVNTFVNYTLITHNVYRLFSYFSNALRFSFGNQMFEEKKKNVIWEYMKRITCTEFVAASTLAVGTYAFIDYFVANLWLGEEFLAGALVSSLLCLELYLKMMGEPLVTLMNVTGKFREDKVAYCSASACNIVLSIFFVKIVGLAGVVIGTLISEVIMFLYRAKKLTENASHLRTYVWIQAVMLAVTLTEAAAVYGLNRYVSARLGLPGALGLGCAAVIALPCVALVTANRYYDMAPIVQTLVRRVCGGNRRSG